METLDLALPLNRTLSEQVANELREAIVRGRLRPGQHIVEREIAQAMRLSRGPVRDAFRILENEGLVVRYAHRGTFVTGMQARDAEEIYSLREPLEVLAVDYAIKYATDEQFDELDAIVDRMTELSKTPYSQVEATDLDIQFHDMVYRISGHKRLQAVWAALRGQVRLLVITHRTLDPADFRERGIEYHRRFVDCLRSRDRQAAHEMVHEHLTMSFTSVMKAIRATEAALDNARSNHHGPAGAV
jgi:DNA-binding GntR family transcriptional regulator